MKFYLAKLKDFSEIKNVDILPPGFAENVIEKAWYISLQTLPENEDEWKKVIIDFLTSKYSNFNFDFDPVGRYRVFSVKFNKFSTPLVLEDNFILEINICEDDLFL